MGTGDAQLERDAEAFAELLDGLAASVQRQWRAALAGLGLTPIQFRALQLLAAADGTTVGRLGSLLGVAASTATDLVDRLEREGLVVRQRQADDRRRVVLRVTDRGRAVLEAATRARRAQLAARLAAVDGRRRAAWSEALRALRELVDGEGPRWRGSP